MESIRITVASINKLSLEISQSYKIELSMKTNDRVQNNSAFSSGGIVRVGAIASLIVSTALGWSANGAVISDFGTTTPTQGGSDVGQLTGGTARDGLNYFSDNSTPPGQTFTTGSNVSGYGLTSLFIKTGGDNANNTATLQTYTLRIYSVSGSTATLLSTYVTDNLLGFPDGDWLQYSGLTNIFQPNTVYAYTHQRNTAGWDGMSAAAGNLYAGGEICLIPTAGGAITFGSSHASDATFLANLSPITDPFVFPTYVKPSSAVAGASVTITAGVSSGTAPLSYQWLFTGTNGVTSKITGATSITYTIAAAQTTNAGSYSLMVSNRPGGVPTVITNASASLSVRAAYNIATIGTTAPTTGTYDIAQLTLGTDTDGLNYYSDNTPPPGQTFTTGSNPSGYTLTGIFLKTAGTDGNSTGTAKTYSLRLYAISGSTATLISTYLTDNTVGYTDGDWLRYSGMTNVLQPNTVYAYTHRQNGSGWDKISAILGNTYAGGQACLIPTAGGTVTFGTSGNLDAAFQVSMVPNGFPAIQNIGISPANPVYVPTPVTLTVQASGANPLTYTWQTDGGLGGAFSNIPSSNTNSYGLSTTGLTAGTYLYQVIVSNANSVATSSVVTLNLNAASAPVIVADTSVNPAAVFAGSSVQLGATFSGSTPITYRWMFNNGSGATAIAGATNVTYSIASAQLTNNGSYYLIASNAISPFTTSSTAVSLLVGSLPQNNPTSAGMFDATSSTPTPGAYDIAQLVAAPPTTVPGINYYVNNGAPPGQTFTTGSTPPSSAGYPLSSIYLQQELSTADGAGAGLTNATYSLDIYSITASNAVLLTSYVSTNTPSLTDGDWLQWKGLTNVLKTNSVYGFSIHKDNGAGWWKLANNSSATDLYGSGQAAIFPASGIGPLVFSSDTTIDAGFMIVLSTPFAATQPTITRVWSGNNLTLSWPSAFIGWRLQGQTNVGRGVGTNWGNVADGIITTNRVTLTVSHSSGSVFYRLIHP